MLKIQPASQTGADVIVALIGTVQREYLPDLEGVVRQAARDSRRLSLDLSQVRLVDRDSVAFLAGAVERGVRLVGCPAYLEEWLRSEVRVAHRVSLRHEDKV